MMNLLRVSRLENSLATSMCHDGGSHLSQFIMRMAPDFSRQLHELEEVEDESDEGEWEKLSY